jgi:hypothetical protein
MAVLLGLTPDMVPIVTPVLTGKIRSFGFGHTNSEELKYGIHPFTVGYRNASETTQARMQISQHAMLLDGAAPHLEDIVTLATTKRVRMLRTCLQVSITLDAYRVILYTCFGPTHQVSSACSRHLGKKPGQLPTQPLIPLFMAQWVQLCLNMWFQDLACLPEQVVAPDLQELFQDFHLDNLWQPHLMAAYVTRTPGNPATTLTLPLPGL